MKSPYEGVPVGQWSEVTQNLVDSHPLSGETIVDVVLISWISIFDSRLGHHGFRIGREIFPKPQILGFLLHELIPLELAARFPNEWRTDQHSAEKDVVYLPDPHFSLELKTSSHPRSIFGNRSYAQAATTEKKVKSGYYLAVNFEKCTPKTPTPRIKQIRFGWLDSEDWIGQRAATGQQARLSPHVDAGKLLRLYSS